MGFSFGGIKTSSKKQVLKLKLFDNPVLSDHSTDFSTYDFTVTVLTDEHYSESQVQAIEAFLRSCKCTRFLILSALNCDISASEIKEDQKTGVIDFYYNNCSNFMDYISQNSPIITVGAALYSLLKEDDIYPNHVEQAIFGKTNFWFSMDLTSKGNWIYPIESFRELFAKGFKTPVDSFRTKLAKAQIKNAIKGSGNGQPKYPPRYPRLNKVFINSRDDFYLKFYEPNKHRKGEILAWDLETSGLHFMKDKIGCITLSFDGITGYYIPWEFVDRDKLTNLFKANKQLGANLKFDIKFTLVSTPYKRLIEGYKTVRIDGRAYRIMNDQLVHTKRGDMLGKFLMETDEITDVSEFMPVRM